MRPMRLIFLFLHRSDLGGRLSTDVVADFVPGVRVVKAFNTLPAAVLAGDPAKNVADIGYQVCFRHDAAGRGDVATLIKKLIRRD